MRVDGSEQTRLTTRPTTSTAQSHGDSSTAATASAT